MRTQYDTYTTRNETVSRLFVITFWSFAIGTVAFMDLTSYEALSGAKGRLWQSVVATFVGNLALFVLLTAAVIIGDGKLARLVACVIPGVWEDDICLFREGLSGTYIITCFMCHGYSLFARCASERCPRSVSSTEIQFCNSNDMLGVSPIPIDNFVFLLVFLVVYQLSFPQLKWYHYAASWGCGLFFLIMVVVHIFSGKGGTGLSYQGGINTVLYFVTYVGLYLLMSWLHRSKLRKYLNIMTQTVQHHDADDTVSEDTVELVSTTLQGGDEGGAGIVRTPDRAT
jgi:hypothetical protein